MALAGRPPLWMRGAGAGAGAAVAAIAVQASWSLVRPSWKRTAGSRSRQLRWIGYLLAGAAAAATIGPWLVLVLLGCGVAEFAVRDHPRAATTQAITAFPLLAGRAVRAAG